jgi:hypothetical protein
MESSQSSMPEQQNILKKRAEILALGKAISRLQARQATGENVKKEMKELMDQRDKLEREFKQN